MAAVARSSAAAAPKRSTPTSSKPIMSTAKPSTPSAGGTRRPTSGTPRTPSGRTQPSPAPTPTAEKKQTPLPPPPPPPAPPVDPPEDEQEEPEPTYRIRSGSYTISRPSTTPQDMNKNVIGDSKDDGPAPGCSEEVFRAHIGKRVLANGQIGILRYFGPVNFMEGLFCGIELDQPTGLHDGQFNGVRYFKSSFKHGTFLAADHVQLIIDSDPDPDQQQKQQPTAMKRSGLWPVEGELLSDVEPNLLDGTLHDSIMSSSAATFDLSSSLSFLKGSKFPGMDTSLTPSELMAQLHGGAHEGGAEAEAEDGDGQFSGSEASPRIVQQSHSRSIGFKPQHLSASRSQVQYRPGQESILLTSSSSEILPTIEKSGSTSLQSSNFKTPATLLPSRKFLRTYSHTAKGFDAFAILIKHYSECMMPKLRLEANKAKSEIERLNNLRLNMENENRLLKEHFDSSIKQKRKEFDAEVQELKAEFEKKAKETSESIRQNLIDEHKTLLASKTKETQKYKSEIARMEKLIRETNAELDSQRSVVDFRSKEFRELQEKCQQLRKELDDSIKIRINLNHLQHKNFALSNALEKKSRTELKLLEKIVRLDESLRDEKEWNRRLRMGKEEAEYKLTRSMYEPSTSSSSFLPSSPVVVEEELDENFEGSNSERLPGASSRLIKRRSKSMGMSFFVSTGD